MEAPFLCLFLKYNIHTTPILNPIAFGIILKKS